MPRIIPVHWKVLICIFKKAGFSFDRQKGSHMLLTKAGISRPISIPTYEEVDVEIIKRNMKTAGMSRETYFTYLSVCK